MGCVYTGSAGGAITIDTPNCANEATGMASIRSASNSKRIVRILNHLARSSFDCPVVPCRCGLRGLNGDASMQGFHGCTAKTVHYGSLFVNVPIKSAKRFFPEMTLLAPERKRREPKQWTRADNSQADRAPKPYRTGR
jgi:hypothetical protein